MSGPSDPKTAERVGDERTAIWCVRCGHPMFDHYAADGELSVAGEIWCGRRCGCGRFDAPKVVVEP